MAVRPYDPVGAMGGLFAPALIRGNRESEEAFARWMEANLRRPPAPDISALPPSPVTQAEPMGTLPGGPVGDQRDAIASTMMDRKWWDHPGDEGSGMGPTGDAPGGYPTDANLAQPFDEGPLHDINTPEDLGPVIGTNAPPTQAPQTQAPQTQAPQTQAPQTQAPQTQAPQTQTQAPPTQAPPTVELQNPEHESIIDAQAPPVGRGQTAFDVNEVFGVPDPTNPMAGPTSMNVAQTAISPPSTPLSGPPAAPAPVTAPQAPNAPQAPQTTNAPHFGAAPAGLVSAIAGLLSGQTTTAPQAAPQTSAPQATTVSPATSTAPASLGPATLGAISAGRGGMPDAYGTSVNLGTNQNSVPFTGMFGLDQNVTPVGTNNPFGDNPLGGQMSAAPTVGGNPYGGFDISFGDAPTGFGPDALGDDGMGYGGGALGGYGSEGFGPAADAAVSAALGNSDVGAQGLGAGQGIGGGFSPGTSGNEGMGYGGGGLGGFSSGGFGAAADAAAADAAAAAAAAAADAESGGEGLDSGY